MGFSVAGTLGVLTPAWLHAARAASNPIDPDLVVLNALVYTVDDAMPTAEAFAARDGRFAAVGPSADMRARVGSRTQVIDAAISYYGPASHALHLVFYGGVDAVFALGLKDPLTPR